MKKFMDQSLAVASEHRFRCQLRTRKLVWVLAFVFASLLVAEYLELPYGYVISSLLSAAKRNFSSTSTSNVLDVANIAMSPEGVIKHQENSSAVGKNQGGFSVDVGGIAMSPEGVIEHQQNNIAVGKNQGGFSVYVGGIAMSPEGVIEHQENNTAVRNNQGGFSVDVGGIAMSPEVQITPQANHTVVEKRQGKKPEVEKNQESTALGKNAGITSSNDRSRNNTVPSRSGPSESHTAASKQRAKRPMADAVSIPEMHNILLENRQMPTLLMKPLWPSSVDEELVHAKSEIENAPALGDDLLQGLYPPAYRNISSFIRSYELMEQMLKVYIYKEGKKPVFHEPRLTGIYASEGWFLKLLESSKHFVTNKPEDAHLYYLPFTSQQLEAALYVRNSHSFVNLIQHLKDYVELIKARHPFWNRTSGADHFLVGCHDWATYETKLAMPNCIRALCNADLKEGFKLGKDVSLPETMVQSAQNPAKDIGGKPPKQRDILAFYAGQTHGSVRPILLKYWLNIDPDMKIFERMARSDYSQHMRSTKYCVCPRGFEVNSPRVVEAIMHECVPVIIADNFVPPFFEILNWESFAVFVPEKDIPNLKKILVSISERRYRVMQYRVKKVRQHFLWHVSPEKYDIFHMILHSVWYNRVFQINT